MVLQFSETHTVSSVVTALSDVLTTRAIDMTLRVCPITVALTVSLLVNALSSSIRLDRIGLLMMTASQYYEASRVAKTSTCFALYFPCLLGAFVIDKLV